MCIRDSGKVDWNKEVHPGAAEIGYDYSFIQAATNDRVPCVFLENGRVVGLDPNDPLYVDYRQNFPGDVYKRQMQLRIKF